jgi:hypothetical protein
MVFVVWDLALVVQKFYTQNRAILLVLRLTNPEFTISPKHLQKKKYFYRFEYVQLTLNCTPLQSIKNHIPHVPPIICIFYYIELYTL